MPKEKYEPPDPRRMYTIMSSEEAANGKKSHWAELEISGRVRSLSSSLWSLTHLTALHLSDNFLSRIPSDIAKLHNLVYLDLSSNKIRSLPAELGNMVSLRELHLNYNQLRVLPFELGKLFQLQTLGLKGMTSHICAFFGCICIFESEEAVRGNPFARGFTSSLFPKFHQFLRYIK
uniref:CCR4-NOT transcription complex subunit 6 n=1 Tax=Rousettus aegyptiacus TaxID=9407 RepID=A0A7J8FF33_ROUAE|nr:CCR4-NOT transcription complex subunit 6 [Rousettus aegyptiacus]